MELKKIDSHLKSTLIQMGFEQANNLQLVSYSKIKSGTDVVIQSEPQSGKTINALLHVVQKLKKPDVGSTRALVIVSSNQHGLQTFELLEQMAKKNQLQIYFSSEKEDFDYDKNMISVGNDVLIGTVKRINDLFASAGFNFNTVNLIVIDDLCLQLDNRLEPLYQRLLMSQPKTQFLVNTTKETPKVINFVEKYLVMPHWIIE